MAKVTVTVCDQCGAQESVRHFEIKEGVRKAGVDLCGVHSEALDQLLGERLAVAQSPARRTSRTRKVTTMEEIEALKKKSS